MILLFIRLLRHTLRCHYATLIDFHAFRDAADGVTLFSPLRFRFRDFAFDDYARLRQHYLRRRRR